MSFFFFGLRLSSLSKRRSSNEEEECFFGPCPLAHASKSVPVSAARSAIETTLDLARVGRGPNRAPKAPRRACHRSRVGIFFHLFFCFPSSAREVLSSDLFFFFPHLFVLFPTKKIQLKKNPQT